MNRRKFPLIHYLHFFLIESQLTEKHPHYSKCARICFKLVFARKVAINKSAAKRNKKHPRKSKLILSKSNVNPKILLSASMPLLLNYCMSAKSFLRLISKAEKMSQHLRKLYSIICSYAMDKENRR